MTEENEILRENGEEDAVAELLSLNIERMRSFTPGEAGIYGSFFEDLFSVLLAVSEGKELPAVREQEDPLLSFWLREAKRLRAGEDIASGRRLLSVCETSLLLLTEVTGGAGTKEERESLKDVMYSYVTDYAGEWIRDYFRKEDSVCSLITDFLFHRTEEVAKDMALFWGERLRARITEELLHVKNEMPSEYSLLKDRLDLTPVPEGCFTSHQKNVMAEYMKRIPLLLLSLLMAVSLFTGCGGKKEDLQETAEVRRNLAAEYPGLLSVNNDDGSYRDIFGVMHALVLDVQPGEKSGNYVYTLCDKEDPEEAWSIESQLVGDIVADVEKGAEVAVLFSGDIVEDPDNVSFIAILEEKKYSIRSAEGTVINNMMNSFTLRTKNGQELTFVKDNCIVDRDALGTTKGGSILVYYADAGTPILYPFRVYNESKD